MSLCNDPYRTNLSLRNRKKITLSDFPLCERVFFQYVFESEEFFFFSTKRNKNRTVMRLILYILEAGIICNFFPKRYLSIRSIHRFRSCLRFGSTYRVYCLGTPKKYEKHCQIKSGIINWWCRRSICAEFSIVYFFPIFMATSLKKGRDCVDVRCSLYIN